MSGKLHRFGTISLAAIATGAMLLAVTVLLMELNWAIWNASPPHRYDLAMRTMFDVWLLILWTGLAPAYVLRLLHVRHGAAYIAAGIGSALLAPYVLLMAMRFGQPAAFCCLNNPSLLDLLLLAFTGGKHAVSMLTETNGTSSIAILAAPGIFWGLVTWRVMRPRPTPIATGT